MNKKLLILISLSVSLIYSCTDNISPLPDENKYKVSFEIADNGYSSSISTRSIDNGYTTEFTTGDCCGLYVIRDGRIIYHNIQLIAERDEVSHKIVWRPYSSDMIELAAGLPDEQYFLYYPYNKDMQGKTSDISSGATLTDIDFFSPLIDSWQPLENQSSAESYADSDLMTAKGTATIREDKILHISFSMTHRMSLIVIDLPKTVYKFTDTKVPDYTIFPDIDFQGNAIPRFMGDSYRYITNPKSTTTPTIEGFYGSNKVFTIVPKNINAGAYNKYNVEGATVTEIDYTIQRGDFLLEDGTLISKDATLTEEQKAKVAAIVFWTPAETDPSGRITPASLGDDRIRSKDYPYCTHGLAVALYYKKNTYWQKPSGEFTNDELIINFQKGGDFSRKDKAEFAPIASLEMAEDDLNRILGYQNTQILFAYNEWCRASGKGSIVQSADDLCDFINTYPAPSTSTGWYIPSIKELHMLADKDVDDAYHISRALKEVETATIIRDSYLKLKQQDFFYLYQMLKYVSSTECPDTQSGQNRAYFLDFSDYRSYIVAVTKEPYFPGGLTVTAMYPVCAF